MIKDFSANARLTNHTGADLVAIPPSWEVVTKQKIAESRRNDHYRHHTISTRTSNFVVEYCCKAKKRNVYRKVVDEHPGDEDFSCGLDFPTLRSS